ncbi:protein MKS1-like [Andrographis paniculata]|uniref:protein MKS1-like n=1 Tax=Andrographis paniculata TaxID=175694 RepID=UPI0021E8890B|nr:protein MKS1-like [Andrographis paniculata]
MAPMLQDSESSINGRRLPSLKINRDSHVIQKPPSSLPSSAKRQPVIIYTKSPKVIHAQSRDFRALVQKLTGYRPSDLESDLEAADSSKDGNSSNPEKDKIDVFRSEQNESCSILTTTAAVEIKQDKSNISSTYTAPSSYLIDPMMFASDSSDFFCPSISNSMFSFSGPENSLSPTMMDYVDGCNEHN